MLHLVNCYLAMLLPRGAVFSPCDVVILKAA